jgi:hypothetical protein
VEGRKIEDMKQFGLLYLYILKCHEKTPCIAILKKAKLSFFFFYQIRKQEGRIGSVWELVPVGGGRRCGKGVRG